MTDVGKHRNASGLSGRISLKLRDIWEFFARIGTQNESDWQEISRIRIYNQMNLIVCLIMIPIMFIDLTRSYFPGFLIALTIFLTTGGGFVFIHKGKFKLIVWFSIILITIAIIMLVMYFGRSVGGELIFLSIGLSSIVLFREWKYRITLLIYVYVAYAISEAYLIFFDPINPEAEIIPTYLIVFFCTLIVVTSLVTYFIKQGDQAESRTKALMEELKSQNEVLRKANHDLSQFAYASSHHFKSPLKNISNLLSLIDRKIPEGEHAAFRKNLEIVKSDAQHLYSLVEDILTYSTLDSTESQIEGEIELESVIARVVKNLEEELTLKNGKVNVDPLPTVPVKESHAELIMQILIQNGIKYNTSPDPTINISGIEEQDGSVWILISDNGIGIETRYIDTIFHPFQRLHTQNEYPGTGIGLTVCKRIINGYHGEIIVSSQENVGSVFQLFFPSPKTNSHGDPISGATEDVSEWPEAE